MHVVDVREPGPAQPGFVVVRPEAVGLCGSDFHYFHGDLGSVRDDELYPRIQGHEFSAIVEDVGPGCPPGLTPGQRVAVWPVLACGSCQACRIGRDNACERITLIGIHVDGALQERLAIPATQAFAVPEMDARLTAFVEPTSIAVRAVKRGRVSAEDRVLVLGGGPIGQAVAIAATDRGAAVLIVDRLSGRLDRGSASGADRALIEPGDDLVARARAWAGGDLPDVVVEATGALAPMRAALDVVAPAGRLVVVGLSTEEMPLRVGTLAVPRARPAGCQLLHGRGLRRRGRPRLAATRCGRAAALARLRARGRARGDRVRHRARAGRHEGARAPRVTIRGRLGLGPGEVHPGSTASPTIRNSVLTTGKPPCTVAGVLHFRYANFLRSPSQTIPADGTAGHGPGAPAPRLTFTVAAEDESCHSRSSVA